MPDACSKSLAIGAGVCLPFAIAVLCCMDMNGDIVITATLPDVLHPAPGILALGLLVTGTILSLSIGLRYPTRKKFWLGYSLFQVFITLIVIVPAL